MLCFPVYLQIILTCIQMISIFILFETENINTKLMLLIITFLVGISIGIGTYMLCKNERKMLAYIIVIAPIILGLIYSVLFDINEKLSILNMWPILIYLIYKL